MKSSLTISSLVAASLLSLPAMSHSATDLQKTAKPKQFMIQCSITLMAPIPIPGFDYLSIEPETGVYNFSYDPRTEKTVKLAVEPVIKNPGPDDLQQFRLVDATATNPEILSIEFSKTPFGGGHYEGTDFGVYFHLPTDKPGNSQWFMGGYSKAASTAVQIDAKTKGYAIMMCRW